LITDDPQYYACEKKGIARGKEKGSNFPERGISACNYAMPGDVGVV
jgi:hypothetical protein